MSTPLLIVLIFSGIGILNTLYLVFHAVRGTDVKCIGFPKEWCKKVQYSKQSKTFGIPNSAAGLMMYTVLFVLAWLLAGGTDTLLWIQIVTAVGFLFSAYFTFVQGFVLKAFCTWCVISAIDFLVLAIAVFGFLSWM